jgi:hypothetical protein
MSKLPLDSIQSIFDFIENVSDLLWIPKLTKNGRLRMRVNDRYYFVQNIEKCLLYKILNPPTTKNIEIRYEIEDGEIYGEIFKTHTVVNLRIPYSKILCLDYSIYDSVRGQNYIVIFRNNTDDTYYTEPGTEIAPGDVSFGYHIKDSVKYLIDQEYVGSFSSFRYSSHIPGVELYEFVNP